MLVLDFLPGTASLVGAIVGGVAGFIAIAATFLAVFCYRYYVYSLYLFKPFSRVERLKD